MRDYTRGAEPANCFDGTRTRVCRSSSTNAPWIMADPGSVVHISYLNIKPSPNNGLGDHVIETSLDGQTWHSCWAGKAGYHGEFSVGCEVDGRFVRLRMTQNGYMNLLEIEVYGRSCHHLVEDRYNALPWQCGITHLPNGNITCDVGFSLNGGDSLQPTWYEPSHKWSTSNNGNSTVYFDLWAEPLD